MVDRSFDSWRQEGNEWWRLGSLADRKDSIGWETLQNDYDHPVQHSAPLPKNPQTHPVQGRLRDVVGVDEGRELEGSFGRYILELTFSGGPISGRP